MWAGLQELCPGIDARRLSLEISPREQFELPLFETVALAVLLRYVSPRTIFEVGTFKGRTTCLMADQTPEQTRVYTLDLPPQRMVAGGYFPEARTELIGEDLRQHVAHGKVTQLYGDSQTFDFSPYAGRVDLVFIDGDYRYDAVKHDTAEALRMLTPGGVIVWDDCHPSVPGVVQCVEEFAQSRPVYRISRTRFAVYRSEAQ